MYKDLLRENKKLNSHWVERYVKFISSCVEENQNENVKMEKHHILPRSLFPEHDKAHWNIAKLTLRQHYISHWMLAKLFGSSQWFSFHVMKRYGGHSILYEYARKYQSEQISRINTGRVKSKENREGISKRTKGTVVVKDINDRKFRVSVDDERYLSGELVFYRKGSKHTEETILKMKESSSSGKTPFIKEGKITYLMLEEGIDMGLDRYQMSASDRHDMSERISRYIWVTMIKTGNHKRIENEMFDESVHIKGRVGFHGFKHINDKRKR